MYLLFDTETTGLPKNWNAPVHDLNNWPRLVQLAWLLYDRNENLLEEQNIIIKPQYFTIPASATKIHGISTDFALSNGADLHSALTTFSNSIDSVQIIIAHNISFDEKIVGAEFIRTDIPHKLFDKRHVCTMKSSTEFCKIPGPYGLKYPTLSELHFSLFQTHFEESHNALYDVKACARSFFKLKELGIIRL